MKIYLDNCCFNRPFDDQTQTVIEIETIAKIRIQSDIREGIYELVWSHVLEFENSNNPYEEKREAIAIWKDIAKHYCVLSDEIRKSANDMERLGFASMDALHVACALKSGCEYFITVDRKILNKSVKGISLINPFDFVRQMGGWNEN